MQTILRKIAAVAAASALVGVPLAGRGADVAPFELNAALPLTGPLAFIGSTLSKTMAAIEDSVNKTGGIQGHPLHFVIQDDQGNPQLAVQIMSQVLAKKPSLVMGGMNAAACLADAPMIKDNGPVLLCFSPSVHLSPGWVYSISFTSTDLYAAAIRYFRLKGYTKIALLLTTDATGQDGDATIPTILARPENKGVSIVADEHYNLTDISCTAQLERIRAAGAEAIINSSSGTPFGTVVHGLRDTGTRIPIWTSQANLNYAQLESYKSIWPPVTPILIGGMPAIVPETVTDRELRAAIDRWRSAMKSAGFPRPDGAEALGWDPMQIVIAAYRHLGVNATPAQLRDYINGIANWPGIFGKINFKSNPQRGVSGEWVSLVQWNPDTATFSAASKPGGAPL